jgi:CubicO group peptidase (beta-lactamase class C family)
MIGTLKMKYLLASICSVFIVLVSLSADGREPIPEIGRVAPESVGMSSEKLAQVDKIVQKLVDEKRLAGALVMVARKDKICYFETFGKMNIEKNQPMREDAIVRFYSMSKSITTAAALSLVEEGKISLDDPVSMYLPELKELQVHQNGENSAVKNPLTIADLMRHTAGLSYGFVGDGEVEKAYKQANLFDPETGLAQMTTKLSKIPLRYEPATDWTYSVSIDVLGRVIEVVTDKTLDRVLAERIFEPLNMKDTGFYVPKKKHDRFAANYSPNGKGELKVIDAPETSRYGSPRRMLSGGGGLVSTARDYMRFLMAISNGGELSGQRILKPETVKLMTTNQLPKSVGWIKFGDEVRVGVGYSYGFSVRVKMSDWDPTGRVGEYGWGGAASTHYWSSPKDDLIVITLEQTMPYSFMTEFAVKGPIYDAIGK